MLTLDPKSSDTYILRGDLKANSNHFKDALLDYNLAIQFNPKSFSAYHQRAATKLDLKDFHGALLDLEQAIHFNPNFAEAYSNRALAKDKLNDKQGAIKDYSKAILINPSDPRYYSNRGSVRCDEKDFVGGINDYKQAFQMNPLDPIPLFNLGITYQKIGETDQALEAYEKGLLLQHHPKILNKFVQLSLKRIVEQYRSKEYQKAKESLLHFQKVVPKTHPSTAKIPQMLKQIEKQLQK